MTPERADLLLRDYEDVRDPHGDPELEAVKAALFLEDAFGITLSDAEIRPDLLGTTAAMRGLLMRRQGTL